MFQNNLLVAMPDLDETWFSRSVVLVCEHNENGAIGLIINRPFDFSLSSVFNELGLAMKKNHYKEQAVLYGGPLQQERGFIIHEPYKGMDEALSLSDDIIISTKMAALRDIADGKGSKRSIVTLGFCGWESQQLEEELKQNMWLTLEPKNNLLYNEPFETRWEQAGKMLGVDLNLISSSEGHS